MKIVWMTWKDGKHPLAGGAEVVNEQLAKRLAADGHEITFVVGGFAGGAHQETRDGFKIVRLGNRYTVYWLAFLYYQQHLRTWADMVVEEINTIPFFTAWYARKPRLLFFHQLCREVWFYQLPFPLSLIGYLAEPVFLRLLGRGPVVTVSQSVRRDLERYGFKPETIHIISEGTTTQPAKDLGTIQKYAEPTVLSLGALRAMKRTLHHIEAFDILKKTVPNAKLIVAGGSEGTYGKKVMDRIAHSPHAKDITVHGFVSPAQKHELFQKAHVLVFTSVKEGWGLVATEAAIQGTPAVVYDVDGLRDSVRHGVTGLVTAQEPAALAGGIAMLLQNPPIYQKYRRAAWEWGKTITFAACYQDFSTVLNDLMTPVFHEQPERSEP